MTSQLDPPPPNQEFNWIWLKWLNNLYEYVRTLGAGGVEGTNVLSTGEGSGTKYLREDGDGTSSWQAAAGGGDVSKVGTPADSQVGVWTGDGTIEGNADLTFDGSELLITADDNLQNTYPLKISNSAGTGFLEIGSYQINKTATDIDFYIDDVQRFTINRGNDNFEFYGDGPSLIIEDTDGDVTGTPNYINAIIEWEDKDSDRVGWIGYGSTGNNHFTINNQNTDGDIFIQTNSANIWKWDVSLGVMSFYSGTTPALALTLDANQNANFTAGTSVDIASSASATLTIDATHSTVLGTLAGNQTFTLPTAVGITGRLYTIKKTGSSGTLTIEGDGTETIDGSLNFAISTQYQSITVQSDNANWWII